MLLRPSFPLVLDFILLHFCEQFKSILANNFFACSFFALFIHFRCQMLRFFMQSHFFPILRRFKSIFLITISIIVQLYYNPCCAFTVCILLLKMYLISVQRPKNKIASSFVTASIGIPLWSIIAFYSFLSSCSALKGEFLLLVLHK